MKKGFLILIAAALLQTAASGQITLPFSSQITNANITVASYPPGTSGAPTLQTTTNLVHPIFWGAQAFTDNAGFVSVSNAFPQQFFRIGYLLPVFQFAIFYNVNLEIDPGAAMAITGPVFCNQSIWEGSDVCTFESIVLAVGNNYPQDADPFANNFNGSGAPTFADGLPASNAPPLALYGFGTNTSPATMRNLLGLPPSPYSLGTAAAYSSNGIVYPANAADLVISNFVSGTNFGNYLPRGTNLVVYYQDSGLTQIPYDYYVISNGLAHELWVTNYVAPTVLGSNTNIYYAGFSWVTNASFVDWREGWNGGNGPAKRVQAVQIDMNLLQRWLTNNSGNSIYTSGSGYDMLKVLHTGNHISSAYIYNSVPLTATTLPAVRVTNGGQLPHPGGSQRGFTVATPFPIYVWKDYNCTNLGSSSLGTTNTIYTLPAALMGDSITILSDNWQDSSTAPMPAPSSTTVNAALITGIVPSNPNVYQNYSGGLENYMRLLENWSSSTVLTFNGSMVALSYSQYATNSWQPTGNYYNAPHRNWSFDQNFRIPAGLPPLTPSVVNYVTP